jgi:UDP-glucose 4-epimerase
MKKNVLVLGGSGFLGSHVADALTEKGYKVTIVDKAKSKWIKKNQNFIKGDICQPEKFSSIIKKSHFIFNFAAIADITESNNNAENTVNINVLGLVKILNLCVKYKIKKYIHASTVYVSGDHGGFYKASKLSAESYVKEFYRLKKLKYCILRYGTLYGPRSNSNNGMYSLIKKALKKKKIIYSGNRESMRNYIHVIDAARVSVDSINKKFECKTIIISGSENYKIDEILRIISEITGIKKITYVKKNEVKKFTHYLKTPYSSDEEEDYYAMKYSDNLNVDLGQGIQRLVKDLSKIKN